MKGGRRYQWLVLLLTLALALVFVLAANVHKESRRQWSSEWLWQDMVRGRLYGLQQFLHRAQPQTRIATYRQWPRFVDDNKEFGQPRQLLFVENSNDASLADYQALLRWVAAGNHVVLPMPTAFAYASTADDESVRGRTQSMTSADWVHWLQRNLHIRWWRQSQKTGADADVAAAAARACASDRQSMAAAAARVGTQLSGAGAGTQPVDCAAAFNQIVLPEGAELDWVDEAPSSFQWQTDAALLWAGRGSSGSHIVRVAYGRGSVVLLSSITPLGNPARPDLAVAGIDRFDHAYLANYLAQDKARIVVLRHLTAPPEPPDAPAWWRLWQAQPLLMSVLLLGLILLVWFLSKRVGGIHRRPHDEVRDWAHYLRMQGRFLHHQGSRADALQNLQAALWAQWQRRWPDWPLLDREFKIQRLCRVYRGISRQDAQRWLMVVPPEVSEQDWVRYVQSHRRFGVQHEIIDKRDAI